MIVNSPRIFGNKDKFFTMKTKVSKRRRKSSGNGHRNHPLLIIVVLILIPAVVFGGYRLLNLVLVRSSFTMENILVEGNTNVPTEAVLEAAGARKGGNLFALDLQKAKSRIEKLPQISSADIKRKLPDTIIITVQERQARAIIRCEPPLAVDAGGILLPLQASGGLDDMTSIYGLSPDVVEQGQLCTDHRVETALHLLKLRDSSQLSNQIKVEAITFMGDGSVLLSAREKGIRRRLYSVKLGNNPEQYPQRMANLIIILGNETNEPGRQNKMIDLTFKRPVSSPLKLQ